MTQPLAVSIECTFTQYIFVPCKTENCSIPPSLFLIRMTRRLVIVAERFRTSNLRQ